MKITTLLETMTTPTSDPVGNQSQQAPKFGRDPYVLEDDEKLDETTSGAISTGEPTNLGVQRRGRGSMLQGIKTSKKFPNSEAVKEGVAEGSGKNVVKSVKVRNFRHDLVDTGMGWQVRIYNGDELYDTGMSKNSEQKGLAALEDAVAYTEKQLRTKRQGVAEQELDEACWKGYHKEGNKKMFGKTYPNCVKNTNEDSLNEFAPDGFNGGDDDEGFSPEIAKMAQDDGFTKGVSLADGATLERAMAINYWHSQHGGMYKQYFAKGFKEGRLNKIKHDNKQYNLNLKLMKDGSIRHGEQNLDEYGDTSKGQKMLAKVHHRAAHRVTSKKADTDPQYARKAQQTQDRAYDRMKGVAEEQHSESCPHCGGEMVSEELMNEKKDACYYKVKSRYKVWPSAYASGALVKCRKKGADSWGNGSKSNESIEEDQLDENLRKWFKEKWVRFGPDGKIRGDCARGDDSEGKPKCLPQSKAHSLGKKGRKYAASKKRREDPNPERRGPAKNVATKKKSNEGLNEAERFPEPEQQVIDATRQARLNREREPQGSDKIDTMLAQRNAQLQKYNETGKFWLKKKDSQEHVSNAYVGKAAANQAAIELLKQNPELKGNIVITAWGPGETPMNEAELSEEQILAKDLKKQLELFKKAADTDLGSKPNDKELGKKPKDKEVQKK